MACVRAGHELIGAARSLPCPWEVRVGQNWYVMKERGIRLNGEWMYVDRAPVGYTAYPYPVGAKGQVFHINLEINF